MTADKLCFNSNNLCTLAVENVYFTPLNSVGYIIWNIKEKSSAENSSTHKIKNKKSTSTDFQILYVAQTCK